MYIRYLVRIDTGIPEITNTSFGIVDGVFRWITGAETAGFLDGLFYKGILTEDFISTPRKGINISRQGGSVSASNTANIKVSNVLDFNGFLLDNSIYLSGKPIEIYKLTLDSVYRLYKIWSGVITNTASTPSILTISGASSFQKTLRRIPKNTGSAVSVGEVRGAKVTSANLEYNYVEDLSVVTTTTEGRVRSKYAPIRRAGTWSRVSGVPNAIEINIGERDATENEFKGQIVEITIGNFSGFKATILASTAKGSRMSSDPDGVAGTNSFAGNSSVILYTNRALYNDYPINGGLRKKRIESKEYPEPVGVAEFVNTIEVQRIPQDEYEDADSFYYDNPRQEFLFERTKNAKNAYYDEEVALAPTKPKAPSYCTIYSPSASLSLGDGTIQDVTELEGIPIDGETIVFDPVTTSLSINPYLIDGDEIEIKESVFAKYSQEGEELSLGFGRCSAYHEWPTDDSGDFQFDPDKANVIIKPTSGGVGSEGSDYLKKYVSVLTDKNPKTFPPVPFLINAPFAVWTRYSREAIEGDVFSNKLSFLFSLKFYPTGTKNASEVLAERYDILRLALSGNLEIAIPAALVADLNGVGIPRARLKLQGYYVTESGEKLFIDGQESGKVIGFSEIQNIREETRFGVLQKVFDYNFMTLDGEYLPDEFPEYFSDFTQGTDGGNDLSKFLGVGIPNARSIEIMIGLDFYVATDGAIWWPGTGEGLPTFNLDFSQFDILGIKKAKTDAVTWNGVSGISDSNQIVPTIRGLMLGFDEIEEADFDASFSETYDSPEVSAVFTSIRTSLSIYNDFLSLAPLGVFYTSDEKVAVRDWLALRDSSPLYSFDETNILEGSFSDLAQSPVTEVYNEIELNTLYDGTETTRSVQIDGTLPSPFPAFDTYPKNETISPVDISTETSSSGEVRPVFLMPSGTEVVADDYFVYTNTDPALPFSEISGVPRSWTETSGGVRLVLDTPLSSTFSDILAASVERRFGSPEWKRYASGLSSYETAGRLWTRLNKGYRRNGTNKLFQKDDQYLRTEADVVNYLEFFTRWNTFQKNKLSFNVKLDETAPYELLDPVEVSDEFYTGGFTWFGWITGIQHASTDDAIRLEVTFDIDPREICIDSIIDEGDGTIDDLEYSDITEGDGTIDPVEYEDIDEEFDFDCP